MDQAERMTGRILKDSVPRFWGARPTYRSEGPGRIYGRTEVFNGDVEVQLLGVVTVGPARRDEWVTFWNANSRRCSCLPITTQLGWSSS